MSEVTAPPKPAPASQWTRQNPFPGKLVVNRRLSTAESEKDTRHFEVDLTNWGLSFEPGDSLAVYPTNRKSTRLNSSHPSISYAVFCLKKKKKQQKKKTSKHEYYTTQHPK